MPTNSRSMYVIVTFENRSRILGWFLRFMGSTSSSMKKKIKERSRRGNEGETQRGEKEQKNV